MGFKFQKFTEVDDSFAAKVTIRQRTGQLGFSSGSINRFGINDYKYIVLFFDNDNRVVGLSPEKENVEGAIEIKHRPGNTYVTAKNFLDKFDIGYADSTRYELKKDRESGLLFFRLADGIKDLETVDQDVVQAEE